MSLVNEMKPKEQQGIIEKFHDLVGYIAATSLKQQKFIEKFQATISKDIEQRLNACSLERVLEPGQLQKVFIHGHEVEITVDCNLIDGTVKMVPTYFTNEEWRLECLAQKPASV
jgi:hypothetical protein